MRAAGLDLPVYVGMRNWHPFLADTLAEMSRAGIRRAIGFIAAAHRSYSGCTQYRENVRDARAALARSGLPDVEIVYVGDWHTHPVFIEATAQEAERAARARCRPLRDRADADLHRPQHSREHGGTLSVPKNSIAATARLIAEAVRARTGLALPHVAVYQSRSGRPEDPWLGPDICDFLRQQKEIGRLEAAVIVPAGFICDHVEVLYDLDTEAAAVCAEIGLPMVRARAVNDHPLFLDMMADVVQDTLRRYAGTRPLSLATLHP